MEIRIVQQSKLTSECWLIQFNGKVACSTCEAKNKEDCGGQDILKTGKNSKGHAVGSEGLQT